jgi:(p)ppGpp synthase/HD superfamily hydrolase
VGNQGAASQLSFLDDLPLARAAADYAARSHGGQRREGDRASFLAHPLEVASLLARSGYPDHVIAAAILHDVLEDTDVSEGEVAERFGPEVAAIITAVSDDPAIADEDERKDELRERIRVLDGDAAVVYAADKISKVRELRMQMTRTPPTDQTRRKLERHCRALEMLEGTSSDERLVELLRFELEFLAFFPPTPEAG